MLYIRVLILLVSLLSGFAIVNAGETILYLASDGLRGKSASDVITDDSALGPDSIESPDIFHTFSHIQDKVQSPVGNCFLFILHRDSDYDSSNPSLRDRQRNEIKVSEDSRYELRGLQGDTLTYTWLFKVSNDMKVSKRFTHIFQFKSHDGDSSQPILSLTGTKSGSTDELQLRWSPSTQDAIFKKIPWSKVKDQWIRATITATFDYAKNGGKVRVLLTRNSDKVKILSFSKTNINMWRGGSYVLPKWGIYRRLEDKSNLNDAKVYFANFRIIRN